MESVASRLPAVAAYIPVVGWLYVILFHRQDGFAAFHLRQSIGSFLFLAASLLAWVGGAWILAWIPYGMLVGVVLFSLVMGAAVVCVIAWMLGVAYALRGRMVLLPIFGNMANRLPL